MGSLRALTPFVASLLLVGSASLVTGCNAPETPATPAACGADTTDAGASTSAAADAGGPAADGGDPDASDAPPPPTLPALTSIQPATGVPFTFVTIALTGHGFTAQSVVTATDASGGAVAVSGIVLHSATSLTATLFLASDAAVAPHSITNVSVTTNGTTTSLPFTTAPAKIVTLGTDDAAGSPAGTGDGQTGDLRATLASAAAGDTIVFDTTRMCAAATCAVVLNGPLPPIAQSLAIDGAARERITIDGHGQYRAFFVDTGAVTLRDLTIANTAALGGTGGAAIVVTSGGGGGGLGAGAGVFVNEAGANVTIDNVAFDSAVAVGGTGGAAGTLGGNPYAAGGAGGMGCESAGGFGGGGSGAPMEGIAGNGGAGGGGGGTAPWFSDAELPPPPASGGALATLHGGAGGARGTGANDLNAAGGGGGGAAAGPAIFVNAGVLTIRGSIRTGTILAIGGAGGAGAPNGSGGGSLGTPGGTGDPGTSDSTPIFNYAGSVNGSTTTGPVSGAL